jgi:HD superfamily phosphodiesterase
MSLAIRIANGEGADLDIVAPAALFHDYIAYKGTEDYYKEHDESARFAKETLLTYYSKSRLALLFMVL